MKLCRRGRGQAIAEFAVIIPVLIIIFATTFWFAKIMSAGIELVMVEREAMRFVCSEEKGNLNDFISRYRKASGLGRGKITICRKERKVLKRESEMPSFLDRFTGEKLRLECVINTGGIFRGVTGREDIRLATEIFTASGGSFSVTAGSLSRVIQEQGK